MEAKKFPLRARKLGDKRYEIMTIFLKELESKGISSILVEDVCEIAKISKVTFFKYFPSKEHVIYYFIMFWQYQHSYEISKNQFSGIGGIFHIFDSINVGQSFGGNLLLAYVAHTSKTDGRDLTMDITEYEYYLFCPDAYNEGVKPLNLFDILVHYLNLIPVPKKELDNTVNAIFSLFYGAPILSNGCPNGTNLDNIYKNSLTLLLKPYL